MKQSGWRMLPLLAAIGVIVAAVWQWRLRVDALPVETAPTHIAPLEIDWSATGYVESRTANLCAPQVGRIAEITVREGDPVRRGQVLARLASPTEEAAREVQREGARAAEAQARASEAALDETRRQQHDRIARAEADVTAARAREEQCIASLARTRRSVAAHIAAADAEVAGARAQLRDLEQGARAEEIAQAHADVESAEAAALLARQERDRQEMLYHESVTPRRALEEAQEAQTRANAALRRSRAALDLLLRGTRPDQITAAHARLRAAQAKAAAAESERADIAVEEGRVREAEAAHRSTLAALAETRSAQAHLVTLDQEARAASARLAQSAAALRQARAVLQERVIRAPFDGAVGRRYADPGDLASPSQPLFSVVESGRTWIAAEVDEQDLAPVLPKLPVSITAPGYAGRAFAGAVERVGAQAVPQTEVRTGARIVRVRISLDRTPTEERRLLKPGMQVHVEGRAVLSPRAVLVPNDALLTDDSGGYVYVVEGDHAHLRRVRSGYAGSRDTEILTGLRERERVVVSGKEGLRDGLAVTERSRRE